MNKETIMTLADAYATSFIDGTTDEGETTRPALLTAVEAMAAELERLKELFSIVDGSVLQAAQRCIDRVKKMCDERTVLQAELDAAKAEIAQLTTDRDEWRESTILANTRFKIAEAKLDALQKQEPVGEVESIVVGAGGFHAKLLGTVPKRGDKLFAAAGAQQPAEALTDANCTNLLRASGKPYPRTCQVCGPTELCRITSAKDKP